MVTFPRKKKKCTFHSFSVANLCADFRDCVIAANIHCSNSMMQWLKEDVKHVQS